jgi:hypothetical protein
MIRKIYILIIFFMISCDQLDEIPPEAPNNVHAYFPIKGNDAYIKVSWDPVKNDNISEYQIYRSSDDGNSFEYVDKVNSPKFFYLDTSISWLKEYYYLVKSKDSFEKSVEFSDTVSARVYRASGKWNFMDYNQLFNYNSLCIDSINFSIDSAFKVSSEDSFSSNIESIETMAFSMCYLDTTTWESNGWMTRTVMSRDSIVYTDLIIMIDTLINNDSTIISIDTIVTTNTVIDTYSTSNPPEYYEINLFNPEQGIISFISGNEPPITLEHSGENCNGEKILP